MQKANKHYVIFLIGIQIFIAAMTMGLLLFSHFKVAVHNESVLREYALEQAQDEMKTRIENLIIRIDNYRENTKRSLNSWGIDLSEEEIEAVVKKTVYEEIHNASYKKNEYIWVNEILDFEGGENYAIRVIHPNLVETEGDYLSTNTTDIKGNLPYLDELNGIKENGEIFQSYYFKNKSDDRITEKLSYAKLYEPYNWIIATGTPMDDLFEYANELSVYSHETKRQIETSCFLLLLLALAMDITLVIWMQKNYQAKIAGYVYQETELDALTGAISRKYGEGLLEEAREKVGKIKGLNCLMIIDLDHFKEVNDSYGHNMGDIVLKRISYSIQESFLEEASLIRWGGDEFLLLWKNLPEEEFCQIGEKVLNCIRAVPFVTEEQKEFHMTASLGISRFLEEDTSFLETLKRADEALYISKENGRNQCSYYERK